MSVTMLFWHRCLRPLNRKTRASFASELSNSSPKRVSCVSTAIRLQEQPLRVLLALLEEPGRIVTREELQQKVWSGGAFGDFEHSLNIAINKIRQALGDSADKPRFVETVPRRGYRFIAPVEGGEVSVVPAPAIAPSTAHIRKR